jgi:hypothetical protein
MRDKCKGNGIGLHLTEMVWRYECKRKKGGDHIMKLA